MLGKAKSPLQRDASSLGSMPNNAMPSLGELEHKAKWELRSNLSDILKQLDIDEVISLIFLVMSTEDLANKGYAWMHYAQQERIHEDLSQMVEHPEALKAILEALYIIQRYDILHDLGLCVTHGVFDKVCASLNSITPCRKTLYRVFSGLTQEDASDIVNSLGWERPVDGELLEMTFTRNLTPNNYEMLIYNLGQKLHQHGFVQLNDYLRPFFPHDTHQMPPLIPPTSMPSATSPLTVDLYPLPSSTPHGLCVIINIKNFLPPRTEDDKIPLGTRYGSDSDVKRLRATFTLLGFTVCVMEDLDLDGINLRFERLRKFNNLSTMACLVVVFMSHGDEDHVFLHDRKCIQVSELRKYCFAQGLIGKPRLFFVQACRGPDPLKPVFLMKDSAYITNVAKDCLISYSTIKGHSSFRSTVEGSCYITYLCETLQMYGDKEPISKIMQRTRQKLCDWVEKLGEDHVSQMSEEQSTLVKDVQLCRGNEEYFVQGVFDLIEFEVIEKLLSDVIDDLIPTGLSEEEIFNYSSLLKSFLSFNVR